MPLPEASGTHRILIVDDERLIAKTLTMIFSAKGYDARATASAEEALELLNTWSPEIALIDVKLPEMNGIDLAIHMKAACPECRLLLISGSPDSADAIVVRRPASNDLELFPKPVHPEVLLERAAQLLA
jgi:DNA-binding response OmpR family regulator